MEQNQNIKPEELFGDGVKAEPGQDELTEFELTLQDVLEKPKLTEMEIVRIEKQPGMYGEQLKITAENEDGLRCIDFFNFYRPIPEKSRLGRFLKKYGMMAKGVKVQCFLSERGFYKILLE